MDFKEQYFGSWQQVWGIHKRFYGIRQQDEETWKALNKSCEQIDQQFAGQPEQKFAQDLLLAVSAELERRSKDGTEATGTQS